MQNFHANHLQDGSSVKFLKTRKTIPYFYGELLIYLYLVVHLLLRKTGQILFGFEADFLEAFFSPSAIYVGKKFLLSPLV